MTRARAEAIMATLAVYARLERKNTDEVGWVALKYSIRRDRATRLIHDAQRTLGLHVYEPWELRVPGLCIGYVQRTGAREHLVPAEPYAHALCGVHVSGLKDVTGNPDGLCPKCFRVWSAARAQAGEGATGNFLWQLVEPPAPGDG